MSGNEIKETWFTKRWRPAMAWSYMIICLFDFIIAPILWSIFQSSYKGNVTEAWMPLTLQGAGLFHLSMGAILGVTAWSRGQEKMGMMNFTPSRSSYPIRQSPYISGDSEGERDYSPTRQRDTEER
jgi:hypothetical protein